MVKMQLDELSSIAKGVLPTLLALADSKAKETVLYSKLSRWNYVMSKDAIEPTLFHLLVENVMKTIVQDEIHEQTTLQALMKSYKFVDFFYTLFSQPAALISEHKDVHNATRWCNDIHTAPIESCSMVISKAMQEVSSQISDIRPWGEVHEIQFSHMPFSLNRWLKVLFHRSAPSGGSTDSINSRGFSYGTGFSSRHGPNIRTVVDLGTNRGYWAIDTVSPISRAKALIC